MALLSAGRIAAAFGATAIATTALLSAPVAAQAAVTCNATYAQLDLPSRSAGWTVVCDGTATIYVDAQVWYESTQELVTLPGAGAHVVQAGQTWNVWTQDSTHTGAADHGVVHIVKDNGNGPATPLAHVFQ
ncbi:hypothetical protein Afil01_26270 [Actinorhabdospora filicis]|uniref:Uncharacterized protein n=1 Tax=Actinorhabdospora filicis TaxID=1785913 RepID=A0A9W6SKY6_9ACTN|nr:hypothetical protein [Actinorhabdospora filicis]GLZ77820.1 hypothetical protein Afil01_26270 [Actinorhabdospora filicis]